MIYLGFSLAIVNGRLLNRPCLQWRSAFSPRSLSRSESATLPWRSPRGARVPRVLGAHRRPRREPGGGGSVASSFRGPTRVGGAFVSRVVRVTNECFTNRGVSIHERASSWFHPDRAAGRDRDHRRADRAAAARPCRRRARPPAAPSAPTTSSRSAWPCTTTRAPTGHSRRARRVAAGGPGASSSCPTWSRRRCTTRGIRTATTSPAAAPRTAISAMPGPRTRR